VNTFLHKTTLIALLLIVSLCLLIACDEGVSPLVKGQPSPAFSLKNLQGKEIHFPQEFDQKVVLIGFWADWCSSCKREIQDFEQLFQKYQDKGLIVIAINVEQNRSTAIDFIGNLKLSYSVLLDSDGRTAKRYGVSSIPSTFVVSRDGDLHTRILGESNQTIFENILNSIL